MVSTWIVRLSIVPAATGRLIPTSNADALKFAPETNQAFEIGAKFNGHGVDVNVAVFRELFKNFQLNTFNGLNFVVENINSCSNNLNGADSDNDPTTGACTGNLRAGVRTQGFEFEAFTRPIPNVQWNAGVTLADTKYGVTWSEPTAFLSPTPCSSFLTVVSRTLRNGR